MLSFNLRDLAINDFENLLSSFTYMKSEKTNLGGTSSEEINKCMVNHELLVTFWFSPQAVMTFSQYIIDGKFDGYTLLCKIMLLGM